MIKPQDLRIENICLRQNKHTGTQTIHYLSASCILDISSNGANSSFIYEPIPLTEEILIKCGFRKDKESDNGFFLRVNNDWSDIYIDVVHGYCEIVVNKHSLPIPLLYVHQLQNLIFSLTQKELTIQL